MRPPLPLFAGLLAGALVLAGCSTDSGVDTTAVAADAVTTTETAQTAAASTDLLAEVSYEELGVKSVDLDVEASTAVEVALSDSGSTGGDGVTVDGSTVTIAAGGTYSLSGSLTAGQVVVDADGEDVTLILDGVSVTSDAIAAIDVQDADEVLVWLAEGSTNALASASDASPTGEDETDAANATLYSTADLWIAGGGVLSVDGGVEDGITSKDGLVIAGGTIDVTAADDALRGKDHLVVLGGDITVDAGGDGCRSDNEDVTNDDGEAVGVVWISAGAVDITAGADAIDAYRQVTVEDGTLEIAAADDGITAEGVLHIWGGTLDISTSYEGLEAGIVVLSGGEGSIVASDDGINVPGGTTAGGSMGGRPDRGVAPGADEAAADDAVAADASVTAASVTAASVTTASVTTAAGGMMEEAAEGRYLEITGGTWYVNADGDGLDSNGTLTISGGTVVIDGPTTDREGALDASGGMELSGGTLAAAGSSGMLVTPESTGDQGTLMIVFASALAEGSVITVTDSDGAHVASFTTAKTAQALVLSTADIVVGEEYTVSVGGTVTSTGVGGLVTDGEASGGSEIGTVTAA